MRIIHLVENLDDSYGGPAKSIPYLCYHLREIGVEVYMLSIQYYPHEHNTVISNLDLHWEKFKYEGPRKLAYSSKIKNRVKSLLVPDTIIHVHNSWTYVSYLGWYFKKKHNIPLVSTPRGSLYTWSLSQRKYLKKVFWRLFQKASYDASNIIHVTAEDEAQAVRDLGLQAELALVPNGIDIPDEVPDKYKWRLKSLDILSLSSSKRYFLFMSRIHPKKGLDLLINSWLKLNNQFPEWELLIVGPEEHKTYSRDIRNTLNEYNSMSRVRFLGLLEGREKEAVFGVSEIFVLPSYTENFGIVIAEALAYRLPVITTRFTPWKEIEDYLSGWYIDLSQEKLTTTLKTALDCNEAELIAMGENSEAFINNYRWPLQTERIKQVYEYVLGGIRPSVMLDD